MIDFVTWPPLLINDGVKKGGQVTKSIIVVTICYKLLCHSSRFLISNFLASTDIKVFGRTYLFAMLLLIGLALFLHPGCFCLAYHYFFGSINTCYY